MKRITEYTNIETVSESDVLPIVDVSDTEQASITYFNLRKL